MTICTMNISDPLEGNMRNLFLPVLAVIVAFGASGCSSGPGKATPMDDMQPMENMDQDQDMMVLPVLSLSVLEPQAGPDGLYSVEEGDTLELAVLASPAPEEALEIHLEVEVPEHLKDAVRQEFQAMDSGDKLAITFTLEAMADQLSLSFQVPDDQTDRADATFTAELVAADHYNLSEDRSATITVTDNDEPQQQQQQQQTRTLSHVGLGEIKWGDADGPPTDGSLTKVTITGLTGLSGPDLPTLKVDRGGAASCTMQIDGSENPGNPGVIDGPGPGHVRLGVPGQGFGNHDTTSVTFTSDSDQVVVSEKNGDTAKMAIQVTC
jgi:hypothetical protein